MVSSQDFGELFANFKSAAINERQKSAVNLNSWLQKYLQAKNFNSAPDYPTLTNLFEFACENLTDAKPGYTNVLKDLLRNIVSLRNKIYPDESYESWIRFVTAFPATSKALYHALEPLAKYMSGPYEYGITKQLYNTAFSLFASLQVASPVGKCLCALFKFRGNPKTVTSEAIAEWVDKWAPYVYATFSTNCRENVLIYVLGPMLRQLPAAFPYFYKNIPGSVEDKIGCLKTANDSGIDVEPYTQDKDLVERLHDHSRFLRFEVLSLILASKQVSKPIPPRTYEILRENADVLFCEASPKFRNQVFAIIRKFLFRIRSSSYAQARDTKEGTNENVVIARNFLQWFFEYMLRFLQPGSPYRCLVTGFQYMDLLLVNATDSSVDKKYLEPYPVPFPFTISIFTPDFMRALINNVPNDYYDIRQSAAKIIQMAPKPVPYLETAEDVDKIANVSLPLISGVRGRQGDGGARICQIAYLSYPEDSQRLAFLQKLVDETAEKVKLADKDIRTSCQEHGLHGYFQALALIFEVADFSIMENEGLEMVNYLLKTIFSVWDLTWDTLTNSAPEGNIPMPLDAMMDEEDDAVPLSGKYGATAQVLLSFSWRAVKESASLLTVLLQRFPRFEDSQLKEFLTLIVRQLTSIRHRGAYSSIAPAYEALCSRCYQSNSQELKNAPLMKVQEELDGVVTKTQLITRRSAGLPMLITGALATNPDPKPAIAAIMERLHEISKLELPDMSDSMKLDLPQVHAFNCLRGTLRESRLSKGTDAYVEPALVLAIEAFNSPVWSIRNCGVMLFSTLHIRLFGSSSTMGAGVFFSRFKAIKPLLYNHLVQYVNEKSSADLETVYPILALLLRLRSIGDNSGLEPFYAPIKQFLSSRIWKVREMSVWVLAAILHSSQVDSTAMELLEKCTIKDQNVLHGHLMALNALDYSLSDEFKSAFAAKLPELYNANACRETKIEVVKLIQKTNVPFEFTIKDLPAGLDPSQRVLNGLVVVDIVKKDPTQIIKFLESGQREVIENLLEFLYENIQIVDASIYKSILSLLDGDVPNIKARVLDIIALVGTTEYSASYQDISSILYNKMEPLSSQQRALKCLGSLVPNDEESRSKWEDTIEEYCDDDSPLDSRLCAIESIGAYVDKNLPSNRLLWNIYTLLSDDEELVRTNMSQIASKLLGGEDFAPRYCEPHILELVGGDYVRQVLSQRDSEAEIAAAKSRDETLFVSEKPNLYRNEFVQMEQLRRILHAPMHITSQDVPLGDSANCDLQIALARYVK